MYVLVLFMSDASPTAERREQMLGLLAEKTFALACAVQQRALEAETAEEMARLSLTFVKLSRSVRQSIALHAKEERDRLRGDQEAAKAKARAPAVARRRQLLKFGVMDILGADWDPEIEEDDGESYELSRSLSERLDDLAEAEDFLDLDPDALIAQLCEDLAEEAARADAVLAPRRAQAPRRAPNPTATHPSRQLRTAPDPRKRRAAGAVQLNHQGHQDRQGGSPSQDLMNLGVLGVLGGLLS
jgi:hypothetical protein